MRLLLISPAWPKLASQTPFRLPPLGLIQVAACVPPGVEVSVVDENVSPVDFAAGCDLVGISVLQACQTPRAFRIADEFRARGRTVVLGGKAVSLDAAAAGAHADSVVIGEGEGLVETLLCDHAAGRLRREYRHDALVDPADIPNPRRELYDKDRLYSLKGWEMPDLLQTARGCNQDCSACFIPSLEGRAHRIRPLGRTLEDVRAASGVIYLVDDSPEHDPGYEKTLLRALRGAGKRWISHALSPDPETLDLAREAGWLWVYHGIKEVTEDFRARLRLYHEHGVAMEAAVLLGADRQSEDDIRRMVDFLLETGVDLAEFSIIIPYPNSPRWKRMEKEGRIIDRDLGRYDGSHVVFRPRRMSPERLQELYFQACADFYADDSRALRMSRILQPASGRRVRTAPASGGT